MTKEKLYNLDRTLVGFISKSLKEFKEAYEIIKPKRFLYSYEDMIKDLESLIEFFERYDKDDPSLCEEDFKENFELFEKIFPYLWI